MLLLCLLGIPGTLFCTGDGVAPHTACPCGNNRPVAAESGCLNSFGHGASLRSTGTTSISADTFVLDANGLPAASTLFLQGTTQVNFGNGTLFGDGLRCVGGSVIRLGTQQAAGVPGSAMASYPDIGDAPVSVRGLITAPGTRAYQVWYRNAASFCTAEAFNLSNGLLVVWGP